MGVLKMRTSKPVSTISYNSDEFLNAKIHEWKFLGLIEFGMWIRHMPEEDEKKSHCHVFLKPAKLIQTTDFEDKSLEFDPSNPEKPFKMVSFRISNESDWLLYSIHDPAYLAEKGLIREFVYSFEDIKCTCEDTLTDIISHVSDNRKGRLEYRLVDCMNRGMNWQQIVSSGMIPLRQIAGAKIMYEALSGQSRIC